MSDKRWSGVDKIPGIGTVTWSVHIVTEGGTLVRVFDQAILAGGELTKEQLEAVKAFLNLPADEATQSQSPG